MIDWQDIRRALPKDGEEVLVFIDGKITQEWDQYVIATWKARGSQWCKDKATLRGVTHWARLERPMRTA